MKLLFGWEEFGNKNLVILMMALELETMYQLISPFLYFFRSHIYSWIRKQLATPTNQIIGKSPQPEVHKELYICMWVGMYNDSHGVDHTLPCGIRAHNISKKRTHPNTTLVQAHLISKFLWHKVYDAKYTSRLNILYHAM